MEKKPGYWKKNNETIKKIYKSILIRVRRDDTEIWEKLNSVESVNGYILNLIREDIRKK